MPNRNQYKSNEEYNRYFQKYREKNKEKIRVYGRKYNKEWRKKNNYLHDKKYLIKYYKKYPERFYAYKIFQIAINKGIIIRENCQVCNKPNAQGHHENYFKPLMVKWFCALHHKEFHNLKVKS